MQEGQGSIFDSCSVLTNFVQTSRLNPILMNLLAHQCLGREELRSSSTSSIATVSATLCCNAMTPPATSSTLSSLRQQPLRWIRGKIIPVHEKKSNLNWICLQCEHSLTPTMRPQFPGFDLRCPPPRRDGVHFVFPALRTFRRVRTGAGAHLQH